MRWFESKTAKKLIAQEKEIIDKFIEDKFGYFALQLGGPFIDFLENSRINRHLFSEGVLRNILFDSSSLPFAEESVDLIICPHFIEQGCSEKLFDELYKTLIPGGCLIVLCFNPFSFAGIRNFFSFSLEFPWNSKFISMSSVQRKMKAAGFSITDGQISNYQPIFSDNHIFNPFFEKIGNRWLPLFGNIFVIASQKKVIALTPIKPMWKNLKKSPNLKEE
tara:strand:+ start:1490 stop:2149 length:660 start_codon:yes stop_codon:yes gene_type:complete